jgi:hypothetical protein
MHSVFDQGTTMLPADRIKILCPSCGAAYREWARKIRGGSDLPCRVCHAPIEFDDNSDETRKVLSAARKFRRLSPYS